jgi:hypothetical protein
MVHRAEAAVYYPKRSVYHPAVEEYFLEKPVNRQNRVVIHPRRAEYRVPGRKFHL